MERCDCGEEAGGSLEIVGCVVGSEDRVMKMEAFPLKPSYGNFPFLCILRNHRCSMLIDAELFDAADMTLRVQTSLALLFHIAAASAQWLKVSNGNQQAHGTCKRLHDPFCNEDTRPVCPDLPPTGSSSQLKESFRRL